MNKKQLLACYMLLNSNNQHKNVEVINDIPYASFYNRYDFKKKSTFPNLNGIKSYQFLKNDIISTYLTENRTEIPKGDSDRTKRHRRQKIREKLDEVPCKVKDCFEIDEKNFHRIIAKYSSSFKEEKSLGAGLDKISLLFKASLLESAKYKSFRKGPITMQKKRGWGYVHIHQELLKTNFRTSDVIKYCLSFLANGGVFKKEVTNQLLRRNPSKYILNNFKLSEIELKFDFDSGYNLFDLVDSKRLRVLHQSGNKTLYSLNDYVKGIYDVNTGKTIKNPQKSLLIIYDRSLKIGEGEDIHRLELRLTGKYIKYLYKITLLEIFYLPLFEIPFRFRNHFGKALQLSLGQNNELKQLQEKIVNDPRYSLLSYILSYAFPDAKSPLPYEMISL